MTGMTYRCGFDGHLWFMKDPGEPAPVNDIRNCPDHDRHPAQGHQPLPPWERIGKGKEKD